MRHERLIGALAVTMVAVLACTGTGAGTPAVPSVAIPSVAIPSVAIPSIAIPSVSLPAGATVKTVQLATLNNSGVQGAATLTDAGNGTTLVIVAVNPNNLLNMPAHIHEGTCANLTPQPKYPLNNVQNGASTTTIQVPLADLTKSPFAINLHKSREEASVYTACGDIT